MTTETTGAGKELATWGVWGARPPSVAPIEPGQVAVGRQPQSTQDRVGDTGIEPVTSSVSGKRSPAELIARGGDGIRTRVHGFAGRCLASRPLHRVRPERAFRADDGIRTRDPHLGKVMRYQLRYIRKPLTWAFPSVACERKH